VRSSRPLDGPPKRADGTKSESMLHAREMARRCLISRGMTRCGCPRRGSRWSRSCGSPGALLRMLVQMGRSCRSWKANPPWYDSWCDRLLVRNIRPRFQYIGWLTGGRARPLPIMVPRGTRPMVFGRAAGSGAQRAHIAHCPTAMPALPSRVRHASPVNRFGRADRAPRVQILLEQAPWP
jgi:hypothetical protein